MRYLDCRSNETLTIAPLTICSGGPWDRGIRAGDARGTREGAGQGFGLGGSGADQSARGLEKIALHVGDEECGARGLDLDRERLGIE